MKRLFIAVILAASMWACDGETPTSPRTAVPVPVPVPVPSATYTLSGVVSEVTSAGQAPIEGVRVLEAYSQAVVKTDTNGFYSFTGLPAGVSVYLALTKEGYQTVESDMTMTINGNTRVDVQLVRR